MLESMSAPRIRFSGSHFAASGHGDEATCMRRLRFLFSVMIDASHEDFDKSIGSCVVDRALPKASVEQAWSAGWCGKTSAWLNHT
jgi:hypothetical protein